MVSNVGKVLARAVFLFCVCLVAVAHAGDDWQPILPEELKMTAEPLAPGAPAIYLYRQVDRDDKVGHEENYVRIKILTEEGRKQADLEIPFVKDLTKIRGIKARTLRPDGTIADFVGQIYEKTIVKSRGVRLLVQTLSLPDVQVGSINACSTIRLPCFLQKGAHAVAPLHCVAFP